MPGLAAAIVIANLAVQFSNSTWVLHGSARYSWATGADGLTLTVSGVLMALTQLLLLGPVVARLGERRMAAAALLLGGVSFALYGLSAAPWMLYAGRLPGVLGSLAGPTTQSLYAARVAPEAQGAAQGALAGLNSLTAIVGPMASTALFTRYAAPGTTPQVPGLVFFAAAALLLSFAALQLTFRRAPDKARPHPQEETA